MKPTFLLHTCCAPCLTSVYEQLKDNFDITVFWFNPNIFPVEEYNKRLNELKRYCEIIKVPLIVGDKLPEDANSWDLLTKGLEKEIEGGKRCRICIKMRLLYTAKYAVENNFDMFATTLSVSPHKNTYLINNIGKEIEAKLSETILIDAPLSLRGERLATKQSKKIATLQNNIARNDKIIFLDRNFKKNNGYKRSVEICKEFGIYRQNYCGCRYSQPQTESE